MPVFWINKLFAGEMTMTAGEIATNAGEMAMNPYAGVKLNDRAGKWP